MTGVSTVRAEPDDEALDDAAFTSTRPLDYVPGIVLLIAVGVLLCAGLLWSGIGFPAGPAPQWGTGVLSGALLTSTGMNGPPVVLMMQALRLPPRPFRATLQVIFFGQDAAAVAAFAVLGYLDPAVLVVVAGVTVPPG